MTITAPAATAAKSGLSLEDATEYLKRSDPRFLLTEATIRGVTLPVFANAPGSLREMQEYGRRVRKPGADYVVYEGERLSYDGWCAETNRIAHALTGEFGVRPGDRVAIAMRNYPEYLTLMMAITAVGAVAVLINAWWTTDELEYGFTDSAAKLVFADGPREERIRPFAARLGLTLVMVRDRVPDGAPGGMARYDEVLARSEDDAAPTVAIDPDDDWGVMYSSGSTGHPKGVVLTHRGAVSATWSWMMGLNLLPLMAPTPPAPKPYGQTVLCATPLFHVTATHPLFFLSIPFGAKFVMMRKWDADEAVRLIETEHVTRFLGVPTMSADLAVAAKRLGKTLPTLESLSSGGAKRPAAQVGEQAEVFPKAAVATGYGMTETNALGLGLSGPDYVAQPDAAGRLYPPIQQIKVVDDRGAELPVGEVGELCMKAATIMRCYLNKPEATAEALKDGWLHTGDLAKIDAAGCVTIVDRKKNIIIRGGENISCLEVEGALHRHPAVFEASVFPIPDERLGEAVGAAVHLRAEVDEAELTAFLRQSLAPFKLPTRYWRMDAPLARGATDKIDRRAIRAACVAEMT